MRGLRWGKAALRVLVGFAAPVVISLGSVHAAEPAPAVASAAANPSPALDLQACRQIALEHQPALAAAQARLAAAVARSEAVDHLRLAALLSRDIPVRRKQASLGIQVGQAALSRAESDTLFAVTYTHLSALYARQQLGVADEAITNLKSLQESIKQAVEDGTRKDVTTRHVDQIGVYLLVAKARREEAVEGQERALSALREAMGVCRDFPLVLADTTLPELKPAVEREQIVALALARRGEVAQAALAAEVTCLEIAAQQTSFRLKAGTFAAGSDIHVDVLPAGVYEDVYKPGAVGPEMPTLLAGHKRDRVEQARAYNAEAEAVADKTRGLIVLEAEQAYLRWLEASRKSPPAREAATAADQLYKSLRDKFDPRVPKVTPDELINAGVLSSQLRLQGNQAAFHELIALVALERVTGGGFCAGFESPAAPAR
jgi:outer membrane protein TolC